MLLFLFTVQCSNKSPGSSAHSCSFRLFIPGCRKKSLYSTSQLLLFIRLHSLRCLYWKNVCYLNVYVYIVSQNFEAIELLTNIFFLVPIEMWSVTREHFNRWYKLGPYYLSMMLVEIPYQVNVPSPSSSTVVS